jgi:glycosyltransferase involved in cell wall biosynthesis
MTSPGRSLLFLVPGTTKKFFCGGLVAELKALQLAKQVCPAEVVTYRQREDNTLFLPDLLREGVKPDALRASRAERIFVVSWGFDVPKLVKQLAGHAVIYHAHTSGYGFRLNSSVPIITVSRNTMGYWGQQSPHSLLYYLPNQISDEFSNQNLDRTIDVLVQARKSSSYLMQSLVPALQKKCRVEIITGFVDDLALLFNRSHVYLYDSAEYWAQQRVTEGFGLPPMEALAAGCQVFSSVNHALSDYLDPGFNCHKIAGYSTGYDVKRILDCLSQSVSQPPKPLPPEFFAPYRSENIIHRWRVILQEVNQFFDYAEQHGPDIPELTPFRLEQMRWRSKLDKLKKRVLKS